VTCPAGVTRRVTAKNAVIFGVACRECPLRARCTTAKAGRTVHLHEHDGLLRAARADWAAGTGLRQDYMAHRPHVERAIAQVATWRGRRLKLRYRGEARNHAWLKRRTAALNLRNRLFELRRGRYTTRLLWVIYARVPDVRSGGAVAGGS
jgi:Transposase DDE domain